MSESQENSPSRLRRINQRAAKLGWNDFFFQYAVQQICRAMGNEEQLDYNDVFYAAAEALLSLWEPGAVVNGIDASDEGYCSGGCPFDDTHGCRIKLAIGWPAKPGPSCPGEGKYKLVRIKDEGT